MVREASVSQWKKSLLQESGYLMHWNQLTSLYLRHIDPVEKLLCNTVAEWDVNSFMLLGDLKSQSEVTIPARYVLGVQNIIFHL